MWTVTVPQVKFSIQTGAFLAFITSLDEVVVSMLVSGGNDGRVNRWDLGDLKRGAKPITRLDERIRALSFSPGGEWIAAATVEGNIWLVPEGGGAGKARRLGEIDVGAARAKTCVAFSDDGQMLAAADLAGNVELWNLRAGEESLQKVLSGKKRVYAVAFRLPELAVKQR